MQFNSHPRNFSSANPFFYEGPPGCGKSTMASLISTSENRVFYEGKLFPKRIYFRTENSENLGFLKVMVSFLGSILTSPLKKTRQVMAVMKTSNLLMLLKMWLFWLNSTIKVTFLECPCCWRWFWSESGWMSQWEVCLDRARNEGKAKGNAWLFQVWQIYILTKKVEYDQQHVGKRLQRRRNIWLTSSYTSMTVGTIFPYENLVI